MSNSLETMPFVRMSSNDVHLRTKNKLACSTVLMTSSMVNIKALCELHLLYRSLQPAVYVVSAGKLLISNITKIHIKRKRRIVQNTTTNVNHVSHVRDIDKTLENFSPQYILNLPCESRAIVNDVVYLTEKHCIPEIAEFDINTTFPLNMMVLKHYSFKSYLINRLKFSTGIEPELICRTATVIGTK